MSTDLECSSRLQARRAERQMGPSWMLPRLLPACVSCSRSLQLELATSLLVAVPQPFWLLCRSEMLRQRIFAGLRMRPLGPLAAASAHEPEPKWRIPAEVLSRCAAAGKRSGPDGRAQAALGSGVARGAARRGRGQARRSPATPTRWPVSTGACEAQVHGPRGQGHPVGRHFPRSNVRVPP